MRASEYWAEQRAVMVATEALNLAATVRNRHNPDCACGADEALTEPIGQGEME